MIDYPDADRLDLVEDLHGHRVADPYRSANVRCNVVVPSVIDTPANRSAMPDADHATWVPPGLIASAILFLAGPGSAATSGAIVPVYGRA